MVSQRDLLPSIRNCLQSLPEADRNRVWGEMLKRMNLSTIDEHFEEHSRQHLVNRLAISAIASLRITMPSTWPARRPYEIVESRLRLLKADD